MATPTTPSLTSLTGTPNPYTTPSQDKLGTPAAEGESPQSNPFSCFGLSTAHVAREWAISQSLLHAALLASLCITLGLNLNIVADALEIRPNLVWFVIVPYLLVNLLLTIVSGVVAVRQMRSRAPSKLVSKRIRARRFATLWTLLSVFVGLVNLIVALVLGYMSAELMANAVTTNITDTPVTILILLVVTFSFFILDIFSAVTANSLRVSLREISARTERRYLLG